MGGQQERPRCPPLPSLPCHLVQDLGLPEKVVMNRWWYAWVVKRYFPTWMDGCDKLIQDYERCLRCEERHRPSDPEGHKMAEPRTCGWD